MSDRPISWADLVALASRPGPSSFRATGRSVLGEGRHMERDTFTVVHDRGRWRIDQQLDPVRVVGDATRDLVCEAGGLRREPAPLGWSGLPSTMLLRPALEAMADLSIFTPTSAPTADVMAARRCWQVELAYEDKDPFTLHVDAETGVRLSTRSIEGTVVLDTFDVDVSVADAEFSLLDLSPDVDLQAEVATPPVLRETMGRIVELSPAGVTVAVRRFDDLADSYTLVLRRDKDVVAFLDRRSAEHAEDYEALLPGRQERLGREPWAYSFDARDDDRATRAWADQLLRKIVMTTPRMDDPIG